LIQDAADQARESRGCHYRIDCCELLALSLREG
jgi:aspartate oxidase